MTDKDPSEIADIGERLKRLELVHAAQRDRLTFLENLVHRRMGRSLSEALRRKFGISGSMRRGHQAAAIVCRNTAPANAPSIAIDSHFTASLEATIESVLSQNFRTRLLRAGRLSRQYASATRELLQAHVVQRCRFAGPGDQPRVPTRVSRRDGLSQQPRSLLRGTLAHAAKAFSQSRGRSGLRSPALSIAAANARSCMSTTPPRRWW